MSELTSCNFCNLKRIRHGAANKGLKVTLVPEPFEMFTKAIGVYTHPHKVDVTKLSKKGREPYFSSWMAEIGTSCEC